MELLGEMPNPLGQLTQAVCDRIRPHPIGRRAPAAHSVTYRGEKPVSCKSVHRTLWIALTLLTWRTSFAAAPNVELENGAFKVAGLGDMPEPPGGWRSVFVISTSAESAAPMLGAYSVESGTLIFKPRFPLAAGVRYHAVYRPAAGESIERWFASPASAARPLARVTHVYPSAGVWPANQLRFYIYFSAPMRRGGVWNHIHLLNESGHVVKLAFLEIDQELWDASNQRLTVLFDPGRIKRGVAPEREIGPPLGEGHRYTIEVERDLPDAAGKPMEAAFVKRFHVAAAVRAAINPHDWRISPPAPGSVQPLVVDFPRPLDYALLEHSLTIRAAADPALDVNGLATIGRGETRWQFNPARVWAAGDYELAIDPALEDLAGNRVNRPFEVDLRKPAQSATAAPAYLRFHVGSERGR